MMWIIVLGAAAIALSGNSGKKPKQSFPALKKRS